MKRGAPDPAAAGSAPTAALVAYGALGLPLAFAALPIYVHVPRLYTEGLDLSLALVGAGLLAARIVDAVTDPLVGWAHRRPPRGAGVEQVAARLAALTRFADLAA